LDDNRKGVKDLYNALAGAMADRWYPEEMLLPLHRRFLALLPDKPRVLDAGCGAGYESMRLAALGAEVVGVDFSEGSIKIAREKNPGLRFELMDCTRLDGQRLGKFDGIESVGMIIHIEDPELSLVLGGFRRVVKPGGYLFLVFREGDGLDEMRSSREYDGEKYDAPFYLHLISRVIEIARDYGFEYFDEWALENETMSDDWKYLIFKYK